MANKRGKSIFLLGLSQIFLLILMTVAIGFVIGNQIKIVGAADPVPTAIGGPEKFTLEGSLTSEGAIDEKPSFLNPPEEKPAPPASAGLPVRATSSQILEQARNAKSIPPLLKQKAQLEKELKGYENDIKKNSGLADEDTQLKALQIKYDNTASRLKSVDESLKKAGYGSSAGTAAAAAPLSAFGIDNIPNSFGGNLFVGIAWAAAVYGGLEFFADMFGLEDVEKEALQYGVSSGVMTNQLKTLNEKI